MTTITLNELRDRFADLDVKTELDAAGVLPVHYDVFNVGASEYDTLIAGSVLVDLQQERLQQEADAKTQSILETLRAAGLQAQRQLAGIDADGPLSSLDRYDVAGDDEDDEERRAALAADGKTTWRFATGLREERA